MIKRILCALVLLLAMHALQAQEESPYVFTRFKKKDGLSSNRVFQVTQDKDGFIWIGMDNGLQRYDGHRFVTIRHNPADRKGLPDDIVSQLHADKKGRLWLAVGKKVGILDRSTYHFTETPVRLPGEELKNGINKFIEDAAGNIMINTGKELLTYHEELKEFSPAHNFIKLPPGWNCDDLIQDASTGNYWIAGKPGLMLYNPRTKKYSYKGNNAENNVAISRLENTANIRRIYIDKRGDLWLCSWVPFMGLPELFRYDVKEDSLYSYKKEIPGVAGPYHEIWGMTEKSDGNFWVHGYGIFLQYNAVTRQFSKVSNEKLLENTIKFDYILNIYRDRDQNFWVCTNDALYLFNPDAQLFSNHTIKRPGDSTAHTSPVTSIIQTNNKEIWVGTWRSGLFSYNTRMQPVPNPLVQQDTTFKHMPVMAMLHRANDEVWIGSRKGDVVIYKPGEKAARFAIAALGKMPVRQIIEDRKGDIWLGSEAGAVIKCSKGNWRDSTTAFSLMQQLPGRVLKLYEDNRGNIWAGTDLNGLYMLDATSGKILEHYTETSGEGRQLTNSIATDIFQYNDSLMFIASSSINVLNTKTKRIHYISTAEGLPANQVTNITRDKAGYIWVGLSNGLCRYNHENKVFSYFDVRNGILTDNFEVSSTVFLSDGRIVMGTYHDFLVFNPDEVLRQHNSTDVKITDVILFGNSLPMDSIRGLNRIVLGSNENSITINYSVLSYLDQNKVTYYHKLEGLEDEWVRSENQQAVYNYLPSGKYTLKVRCMNGNGIVSEKDTLLQLQVMPPFWRTWWFALLTLVGVAVIAYSYYHIRKKQTARLEQIRERIATDLHDDMGSTLSSIRIFSDVVKSQIGNTRPQAVSMLEKISVNASQLSENMQDIIWTIKRDHDRLEDLVARMREFGLKLCDAKDIAFRLRISDSFRTSRLNLEERRNLYLIFKEALNNSVKYSGCTEIGLFITQQGKRLKMVIEDNGRGFAEATVKKGNGLNNISKRAQEVNGFARIESAEGKGTRIDVLIKLN